MSEQSIIALVAIIVSGAVGLATLVFNAWRARKEQDLRLAERQEDLREWYARNLFEKRVAAAQGAMHWMSELVLIFPSVHRGTGRPPNSAPEAERLRELAKEMRSWYHNVSFYLPIELTSGIWGFLNHCEDYLLGVGHADVDYISTQFLFPAELALDRFEEELRAQESSLELVRNRKRKHVDRSLERAGILEDIKKVFPDEPSLGDQSR